MRQKMGHSAKFLRFFETAFKHLIYYTFKKNFLSLKKNHQKRYIIKSLFLNFALKTYH